MEVGDISYWDVGGGQDGWISLLAERCWNMLKIYKCSNFHWMFSSKWQPWSRLLLLPQLSQQMKSSFYILNPCPCPCILVHWFLHHNCGYDLWNRILFLPQSCPHLAVCINLGLSAMKFASLDHSQWFNWRLNVRWFNPVTLAILVLGAENIPWKIDRLSQ